MQKIIPVESQQELQSLFGLHDQNIRTIEKEFRVKITLRGEHLKISGTSGNIKKATSLIEYILDASRSGQSEVGRTDLLYLINNFQKKKSVSSIEAQNLSMRRLSGTKQVGPKTKGQHGYVEAIKKYDVVFGIGPAGTGKTYLAMFCAVEALKKQEVRRIILTRPAIEAGESLGFLPGDMYEKISPYLRPLYDALYDMMEASAIEKYLETGIIEVAPLAYMRGRTLNDAFIILDEAQNCTVEQMKMFLTRLGFDSKAVITGDITQSDLPDGQPLGLLQAQEILKGIEGIKFVYFSGADVVRHALVQKIIEAYDKVNRNK
ncbi:MAG: PhoH family protein [Candidatus Omnitrophica bacterium]|nr:PhoH family protein [Candidatus Omnitrophota bacterium]MBU4473276.1 PhoH family protein [Candidatus Omnitrophota bacterium]MCG2706082.1 PhoH family protein [Candidatus Omnitrophota bacterium]